MNDWGSMEQEAEDAFVEFFLSSLGWFIFGCFMVFMATQFYRKCSADIRTSDGVQRIASALEIIAEDYQKHETKAAYQIPIPDDFCSQFMYVRNNVPYPESCRDYWERTK